MHLKTLTIRGFKSFASATTFEFEPGVTAVVGPNGSGKSNVVDALAWVMGEQGAKTLRGGKMEDVIFAGTAGRPPLGRAHVSLTIDNADGALPIEYAEVTISRTLFRSGGSEYAINGSQCRLLDIQELLSDSGLGREMHVIVGQGQLDRVLHATPEDRRGFIEEAAGILKHRRRKERTVRKLEAMQANLSRLGDLTAELRRQLGPLGRQAQVARRAQTIQADVRDARARLLADDIATLRAAMEQEEADQGALDARRAAAQGELDAGRRAQADVERSAAAATPHVNAARDTWYRLSQSRERLRALASLADERRRLLGSSEPPVRGRDPEALERQARQLRTELEAVTDGVEIRVEALADAEDARAAAEEAASAEDRRHTALLRAQADRREGLARLAGQVAAARSRVESAEGEVGRLRDTLAGAAERQRSAAAEYTALESQIAGVEAGEEDLDTAYEEAAAELEEAEAERESLLERRRRAAADRQAQEARIEALLTGFKDRDATASVAASAAGVLGRVADLVRVEPGYEAAVAAVLGPFAEGLAMAGTAAAAGALGGLKADDAGQAALLVGSPEGPAYPEPRIGDEMRTRDGESGARSVPALPQGARWLADVAEPEPPVAAAVFRLLRDAAAVPTLEAAVALVAEHPQLAAATQDGDVVTAAGLLGGSAGAPSTIELQGLLDAARDRLAAAQAEHERCGFALAGAQEREREARGRAEAALAALHDSDARFAAVAEKLAALGTQLRGAEAEEQRQRAALEAARTQLEAEQVSLEAAAERLELAEEAPDAEEPDSSDRDRLQAEAAAARARELEARLALRAAEEQHRTLEARAQSLERAAESERRAAEEARRRAERRAREAARAGAVAAAAREGLSRLDGAVDRAAGERDAAEERRAELDERLGALRRRNDELARELADLNDAVHRDELARAEQRLRLEALEERVVDELGMAAEELVRDFGPHRPVPVPPEEGGDKWAALRMEVDDEGNPLQDGVPFVRAEQEKRLRKAERDLAALGKVNPLALEEFAALEERHRFLATQLEDLQKSRKDLLQIIAEVDERVQRVFAEAFADTAVQFERVFGRLFPGGEGRLVLTDPEDLLTTGIEVEARPAGKKIKRLSLLSGGERSLTAVALLVAIFKARPSPFYVMDEVEAALDDTNLGRLITIFEELRESSQLIVITHQKRTMEVADALYGVSMRGDGVSTVISQKLDRVEA
ncbi:chromosome segregation protein SMC [Sinomonas atrocyanea]|uniref:chromosome segregation protein SMC n=1 Tax=Sinomonas atrocyanea TaxID=37927 RepID=UPI00277F8948|nr:chromosome segregation protein SMC [Sinomonas atrocyanea]MDQ0258162.1 chromosome segregation protein [Sinomonas atrocyanea]MDR6623076.1 chromosome segregation protein [Sinomonas atrocyanea]